MNQVTGAQSSAMPDKRAVLGSPLRIAAAAVVLFVVIELATIPLPDDGLASDVRFLTEIGLALVFIGALAAAAWRRLRRD